MRFFVTGTDTGVGKTFVSVALAKAARAVGHRVFAFKPIETGVVGALGEDQAALVSAAGRWQEGPLAGTYQFAFPAAPSVAAAREQRSIDLDLIQRHLQDGADQADVVIVEGAGGWRVPIDEVHDMGELARRSNARIVLVGRGGLGTINHSLLSLEAIQRDGFDVAAIVLSNRPEDAELVESNVVEIQKRAGATKVLLVSQVEQLITLHVEHS